jgi:hypothetical protein
MANIITVFASTSIVCGGHVVESLVGEFHNDDSNTSRHTSRVSAQVDDAGQPKVE